MFGNLFFDESRVDTAFRICRTQTQQRQHSEAAAAAKSAYTSKSLNESVAPLHRCAFSCRGEVALPSLRASLLWWLDADTNVIQLLVLNDNESSAAARTCQSRLLSVEVPARYPGDLLTCGVTRNYMGDNGVAVVWVLNNGGVNDASSLLLQQQTQQLKDGACLTAGFVQVTVQREVDNTGYSNLLLVSDEQMVDCAPLTRIPSEAFAEGGKGSACVVAELPDAATAGMASLLVLTDGAHLWWAQLLNNGAVHVSEFADDHRRNTLAALCNVNEEVRLLDTRTVTTDLQQLSSAPAVSDASELDASTTSSNTRWFRRFLGNGRSTSATRDDASMHSDAASWLADFGLPASVKRQLYASVSAVQQSPFFALTRWNGQVEIYSIGSHSLTLAPQYPIGVLPRELLRPVAGRDSSAAKSATTKQQQINVRDHVRALPAGTTVQWATRHPQTQLVHVVTCLADSDEGRHPYLWTSLPPLPPTPTLDGAVQGQAGEILAHYCTFSVAPPTLSSTPLACAIIDGNDNNGSRLVLVSDVGVEEDAHLLCTRSLGALALRGEHPHAKDGVATVVQIVEADGDDGGFHGLLRTSRMHGYLCQGVQMQGVAACGAAVVMMERGVQPCRLYTMEDAAADALVQITESVVVGVEEEDVYELATDSCRSDDSPYHHHYSVKGCSDFEIQRRVHYVPLIDSVPLTQPLTTASAATGPFALYWEGVNVIQSCAHGARLMAELLRDVLLATTPVTEIASLPRFLSEAHLSGYTASLRRNAPATTASVLAAVQLALSSTSPFHRSDDCGPGTPAFYEYSRLYVTQATTGKLLARLVFLTTTYLGWQSTQSIAFAPFSSPSPAAAPSADWFTQQIVTALEVLVAAYHAVPLAGSDIVRIALVEDDSTQPTSDSLVAALLPTAIPSTLSSGGGTNDNSSSSFQEMRAVAIVQVVNRLRRCGTPRTTRACTAWVQHLTHRFPLLQHYQLLSLLENAAAPSQSARVQACCECVCRALACESPADVVNLLFLEGLFLLDVAGTGSGSAFRALWLDEVATFIAADPAVAPKLYAVGVLRRATGLGALYTSLSATLTRRYLYAMLTACDEAAERLQRRASTAAAATAESAANASHPPFQQLRRAFAELEIDVLLTAAQASVSQADMASCFHDVQTALDLMVHHRCLPTYAEVVQVILSSVVEVACTSQANMSALLRVTTIRAAQLEESLILKWYNYIARLPTKSASEATEALRYRAIMGLHRYLMNRHSYAQCARLMSNLATLIRCSPLRRSASVGIAVSELAGLALHAATMIASSVPMPENGRTADGLVEGSTSDSTSSTTVIAGSPLSLGYSWQPSSLWASPVPVDPNGTVGAATGADARGSAAGNTRWLTRADIPWLQRRLYQAQCERQLWRRGCTLDCTDLWVEGASAAAYHVSVEKLVCALMQTRLWRQAFRFACLSDAYDPCRVLEEWAIDLLRGTQRSRSCSALDPESEAAQQADRAAAWEELVSYCGEISTLENQFAAFVRTVTAALTYAYEDVPAELLVAHRMTDAYTAMSTLFHVVLVLRRQADRAAEGLLRDDEEAAEEDDHRNTASSSTSPRSSVRGGSVAVVNKDSTATITATRRNVWRALSAAACIGLEILQNHTGTQGVFPRCRAEGEKKGAAASVTAAVYGDTDSLLPVTTLASSAARSAFSSFTAGVLDPITVCATELLNLPAYRDVLPTVPGVQEDVNRFLDCINTPNL